MGMLRFRYLFNPASMLLLLASTLWLSKPVQAAWPCTWAPGEFQVGEDRGIPLCERREESNPGGYAAPRAPRYLDNYIAVAWHPNANDVWATWNHRTEAKSTEKALSACKEAMGEGCTIAVNGWNSSVAIARDQDNIVWQAWGNTPETARQKVLTACTEKKAGCQILHLFTAEPILARGIFTKKQKSYFPDRAAVAPRYAMIAWPEDISTVPSKWQTKVWIVSGQGIAAEMEQRLLSQCQKDSGTQCKTKQNNMNGVVFRYRNESQGFVAWNMAHSRQAAEQYVQSKCAETQSKCQLLDSYDAATQRFETLEDIK
jgi:hypothetical protein